MGKTEKSAAARHATTQRSEAAVALIKPFDTCSAGQFELVYWLTARSSVDDEQSAASRD